MKHSLKIIFALIIIFSSINLYPKAKLSPGARKIEKELKTHNNFKKIDADILLKTIDGKDYISSLIKINNDFDLQSAIALGIQFGTIAGDIRTVQIPVESFIQFINTSGLEYLEYETFACPVMDSVISVTRLKPVLTGTPPLPQTYSGKGVIVGIVDIGFDYLHPAFFDSVNNELKIKRVWEQSYDGNHPDGFSYGKELTKAEEIIAEKRDIDYEIHGTHVAGIAAGQGWPTQGLYGGIAQDADIVLVALKQPRPNKVNPRTPMANVSDFVDGINYIFKYAESQNKPVVVNLSWGSVSGPKDGNSLFSQALRTMVGEGKIFVCSAGNNGDGANHVMFKFTSQDTIIKTYFAYSQYITIPQKGIWLDIWGDSSKTYDLNFSVLSLSDRSVLDETGFVNCSIDKDYNFTLHGDGDTLNVNLYSIPQEYNGRSHYYMEISSNITHYFALTAKAKEGNLHIWNLYRVNNSLVSSNFLNLGDTNAVAGDNSYTISDWISGPEVIGVGAYVSKTHITNETGQIISYQSNPIFESLASFSSRGPSLTGLIKPDFAAPGMGVVAPINSADTTYGPKQVNSQIVVTRVDYNGEKYPYAMLQGTSMSSPVATGTIALMLQADPKLTPAKILALIDKNARTDNFTGTNIPNNNWGWGKLNAFITMKDLLGVSYVNETYKLSGIDIYPNPADKFVNINLPYTVTGNIFMVNTLGQTIIEKEINSGNKKILDLQFVQSGLYFLFIKQNGKIVYQKMLVVLK